LDDENEEFAPDVMADRRSTCKYCYPHNDVEKRDETEAKGALNPIILNLTVNREKFWL